MEDASINRGYKFSIGLLVADRAVIFQFGERDLNSLRERARLWHVPHWHLRVSHTRVHPNFARSLKPRRKN